MPIQQIISQQVGSYINNRQCRFLTNSMMHLPTHVREQWKQLVENTILPSIDTQHDTFDDVYKKVANAKIKGVGTKTLIETAAKICFDKNIYPDDCCWYMCVRDTAHKQLITALSENVHFSNMIIWQKIDFLLKFGKVLLEAERHG